MATHNDLGKKGEEIAADYLRREGYTVLEMNWSFKKAEIDVIASKDGILAIVEVKTRSGIEFGQPEDFVKKAKIQNLIKAVNHYVESFSGDPEIRFDIVAINKTKAGFDINHLKDAFFYF